MRIDAEVVCRKEPYGPVCRWEGGKVARVYGDLISSATGSRRISVGDVFEFGRLRMRIVSFPFYESAGTMDAAAVMLESPHAQIYWYYRERAEWIIRGIANVEMRLWAAWRGLCLKPAPEGERLKITSRLADLFL